MNRDVGAHVSGGMGDGARSGGPDDAGRRPPRPVDDRSGAPGLELAPHLASIGRGRRWVAAEAVRQGLPDARVRVVQLLASELIANAVLHGPPGGAVRIRVDPSPEAFRVEVDDASTTLPRLVPVVRDGGGGRGLTLVDRLADRWGYQGRGSSGKTVWFEVRARRQAPPRARPSG